jgi:anaerobic ribonucleoside-triphosphate reductase activating protein
MFARGRGTSVSVAELVEEIEEARGRHGIEGITVLGGEPLEQMGAVTALCEEVAAKGLGVIVFSGYRLEEARALPGFSGLWRVVDTLVDGRYDRDRPEPPHELGGRRFIGSRNQELHHRSDRYRDPEWWHGAPRVEVDVGSDGSLRLHGEPGALRDLLSALER